MTEVKKKTKIRDKASVLEEIVQAHKQEYTRRFKRRWGHDPNQFLAIRIALIYDIPPGGDAGNLVDRITDTGVSVTEWIVDSPPLLEIDPPFDAVVVMASDIPEGESTEFFRRFLRRAVAQMTIIAGVERGVALLAREGFLGGRRAASSEEERQGMEDHDVTCVDSPIVQDGAFLSCRTMRNVGDLVRGLMEILEKKLEE